MQRITSTLTRFRLIKKMKGKKKLPNWFKRKKRKLESNWKNFRKSVLNWVFSITCSKANLKACLNKHSIKPLENFSKFWLISTLMMLISASKHQKYIKTVSMNWLALRWAPRHQSITMMVGRGSKKVKGRWLVLCLLIGRLFTSLATIDGIWNPSDLNLNSLMPGICLMAWSIQVCNIIL